MAEIHNLIKQVEEGADPAEVGAHMRDLITATAPTKGQSRGERVNERMVSDEDDYDNSFNSVTAAWIAGQIDDEQYNALQSAVTGEGRESE
jgi:hypothetical protein